MDDILIRINFKKDNKGINVSVKHNLVFKEKNLECRDLHMAMREIEDFLCVSSFKCRFCFHCGKRIEIASHVKLIAYDLLCPECRKTIDDVGNENWKER